MLQERRKGVAGSLIGRQLKKYSVTRPELDDFLNQAPPRRIPGGIARQVMGDQFPLIPMGMVFTVVGLVLGGVTLVNAQGADAMVGLGFLVVFPLAGTLMTGITWWHRGRKARVLREGHLYEGRLEKVEATNSYDHEQMRHRVTIRYASPSLSAGDITTTVNAHSVSAEEAYRRHKAGEPVRVLVDPRDPQHVVCMDLLALFE